jgi:FAD:protein FMN transferase
MLNSSIKLPLLGKNIEVVFYDVEESIAKIIFEEIYEEGIRLQKIFNFFDQDSELSQLNKKRIIIASKELLEVIKKALVYCEKTNGEYDISIGKQIIERKKGQEITPINCSFMDIEIKENIIKLNHPDVIIDLGSIAKGYITDKLVEFVKDKGIKSGFIDSRGDIRVFGKNLQKIEIQHPRDKEKILFAINLKDSAIATSGDYNQFYQSYDKPHILRKKDLISVSVIAPTLIEADALASVIFLLEKEKREAFLKVNSQIKVFTIDKDLNEKEYNGFSNLKIK